MFGCIDVNSWVRYQLENGQSVSEEWMSLVTDPELLNAVSDGWLLVSRGSLFKYAKTLHERAFTRLIGFVQKHVDYGHTISFYCSREGTQRFPLTFEEPPNLAELLLYCQENVEINQALSNLPMSKGSTVGLASNRELVPALQDLADAVTWEGSEAFVARYYPGAQNVEPLTDEHVRWVMLAMQREVERESHNKRTAKFIELPHGRQVALAERRRLWFSRFGITPHSWKSDTWSLWEVNNTITWPPDGYYCGWDEVHPANNAYTPGV